MNINTKRTISILAASLFLFACNEQAAESTAQAQLPDDTNSAPIEKMTFSGNVLHPSPSGIDVNVKVGDSVVGTTTISQSDGSFSVEIDGLTGNELVTLEAVQSSSGLHLVNVGNNFAIYKASASNGAVNGLKISPVSTASFALAKEMSSDGSIDSREEFDSAIADAHAVELINVAVALTLVTDGSNNFALPAEFNNSLEFALDMTDSVPAFLQNAEQQSPGIVSQTTEGIFDSSSEFSGFAADRDAGVYMNNQELALYVLYAGNSGKVTQFDDDFPATVQQWNVNTAGDLVVEYNNPQDRDIIRPIQDSKSTIQSVVRRTVGTSTAQLQPSTFSYYAFGGTLTNDNAVGNIWSQNAGYAKYRLDANGSGNVLRANGDVIGDLSWIVGTDGRVTIRESNGSHAVITDLVDNNSSNVALMVTTQAGGVVSDMMLVTMPQ